ncbi:nuclear pore complex protein Nup188 [Oratosquilla oratoria]|uniref:nuclear pore complex protein Nup188 n=1 Tax=Oratosquilla oratoria TaxID=337810 RepID=UPI003F760048
MTTIISGKVLWTLVSGVSILPSDEVVGEELEAAAPHLRAALGSYKPAEKSVEAFNKESKLASNQKDLVAKLSKLLDLDAKQCWELFKLYLLYEFKGSQAALESILSSERELSILLANLLSYYLSERLFTLRCLRHVLSNIGSARHPYQKLFQDFVRDVLDKDGSLGETLIKQLKEISIQSPPTVQKNGPNLPPQAVTHWVKQNLCEQRELLVILLIYYSGTGKKCSPENFVKLLRYCHDTGFGKRLGYNEHITESHRCLVELLAQTQCLLLVRLIDVDADPSTHDLCKSEWVSKIDPTMKLLGSQPCHMPPLIAWFVVQQQRARADGAQKPEGMQQYLKMGRRALEGNVFQYLQSILDNPVMQGDCLVFRVSSSIIYSLVCACGAAVDMEKAGVVLAITSVLEQCLEHEPPAHLFWLEEGGAADLVVPSAIASFPLNYQPLLGLATALAKASPDSCSKVMELLGELPSITCQLSEEQLLYLRVVESECLTTLSLTPFPGITIPASTHGTVMATSPAYVVTWQHSVNGWQLLLLAMENLDNMLSSGSSEGSTSAVDMVTSILKLVIACVNVCPDQSPAFAHITDKVYAIVSRVANMTKPPPLLVAALIEYLAQIAASDSQRIWSALEGCALFPSLPPSPKVVGGKRGKSDPLLGYRAGQLRALVCGGKKASGTFPILKSYMQLIVKGTMCGVNKSVVRGGVVFVVQEVLPMLLQWYCYSPNERIAVLQACLSLIHNTLVAPELEQELKDLVANFLLLAAPGITLLTVLASGYSSLESIMQEEQAWDSGQSQQLTRTVKLALSILYRLTSFPIEGKSGVALLLSQIESLKSLGTNAGKPHLALLVARYIYHSVDPRLPNLALKILAKFAQELDVPLVACLGAEAEGIRDALLTRLDAAAEDVQVKVAIVQLLTAATTHQPGLMRSFITPPDPCLETLVILLEKHAQCTSSSSRDLVGAITELMHSLWSKNYNVAKTHLRENKDFWTVLTHPLTKTKLGEVSDAVVANTMRVVALEYFMVTEKVPGNLDKVMKEMTDEKANLICKWSKHVMRQTQMEAKGYMQLLSSWRDLLVVIVVRAKEVLTKSQKNTIAMDVLEVIQEQLEESEPNSELLIVLGELYLSLVKNCGPLLVDDESIFGKLGQLLSRTRAGMPHIPAQCHALFLGAVLLALTNTKLSTSASAGAVQPLLDPVCSLAYQYCSRESTPVSVLKLTVGLLHECLLRCPKDVFLPYIQTHAVISALLHAAKIHVQKENPDLVSEILYLLSTLSQVKEAIDELNTETVAINISLPLSSQVSNMCTAEIIWLSCAVLATQGVTGVEGAIDNVCLHLNQLTAALHAPHLHPKVAEAAAAVTAALAPHSNQWIVHNPTSYSQITQAVARCVLVSAYLLRHPKIVQLDLTGADSSNSKDSTIGSSTATVLNQLLQVLSECLGALRAFSPDITELLFKPGVDVGAWQQLLEPSFRPLTPEQPNAQLSFASCILVLDLYDSQMPKEFRGASPARGGGGAGGGGASGGGSSEICLNYDLLTQCMEEAFLLLISQAALFLLSPDTSPRDSHRIKRDLKDELNSFFGRWIGRKIVPLPAMSSSSNNAVVHPDIGFLKLMQKLVDSLSNSK